MGTTISIRFEEDFLHDMELVMRGHRYLTKAEFIREAVRNRIKELASEKSLQQLEKVYGASKRKTTKAQMKKAKAEAFEEIAKRF